MLQEIPAKSQFWAVVTFQMDDCRSQRNIAVLFAGIGIPFVF
jgi:hypothetical protein